MFVTLAKIWDRELCKNSWWLNPRKTLHLTCSEYSSPDSPSSLPKYNATIYIYFHLQSRFTGKHLRTICSELFRSLGTLHFSSSAFSSWFWFFILYHKFSNFFKPFKKIFFGFWYLRENATQVSHSSSSLYFCVTVEVSGWRCSIPFEICWQKSTQTEIFDFNKASKIWILKACSLENWVGSSSGVFCPRQTFNHFHQGAPS